MDIKGLNFERTCSACPEQYDVYDSNGSIVGYIRLRWDSLTCEYPDVGGELIYEASVGDGWAGCFQSDKQREYYLDDIADKVLQKINNI